MAEEMTQEGICNCRWFSSTWQSQIPITAGLYFWINGWCWQPTIPDFEKTLLCSLEGTYHSLHYGIDSYLSSRRVVLDISKDFDW